MNGGTSTSATDPHHHLRTGGYLGMGIPGLGTTPMTPAGNGFGPGSLGGVGMGGVVGPELKHHADFLSRLLAATPSYMSEVGNPPPGFFSDWLRRLVSKPEGNRSGEQRGGTPDISVPSRLSPSAGSSVTYGEGERNGGPLESPTTQAVTGGKRRKRSRLNDHHLPQHHHASVSQMNSGVPLLHRLCQSRSFSRFPRTRFLPATQPFP
jgi:hypothetical protein